MKVPMFNGNEYMKPVREFLESQGYTVGYGQIRNTPDGVYKVGVGNAGGSSVWVRAEHGGTRAGFLAFAGLHTTMTRNVPAEWEVAKQDIHADRAHVYLVTLPKADPVKMYTIKG